MQGWITPCHVLQCYQTLLKHSQTVELSSNVLKCALRKETSAQAYSGYYRISLQSRQVLGESPFHKAVQSSLKFRKQPSVQRRSSMTTLVESWPAHAKVLNTHTEIQKSCSYVSWTHVCGSDAAHSTAHSKFTGHSAAGCPVYRSTVQLREHPGTQAGSAGNCVGIQPSRLHSLGTSGRPGAAGIQQPGQPLVAVSG